VGIETAKSRLRYAIRKLKASLASAQVPAVLPLRARRHLKAAQFNAST